VTIPRPELSIVLPGYNCAEWIGGSVRTLEAFLDARRIDGEIIVVDDGSTDATASAAQTSERVRVLRQPVNLGKGAALRAGMAVARGTVRAFTDADLPYGTEPLESMMYYIGVRRYHAAFGDRTLPGSAYAHAGIARETLSGIAGLAFRTLVVAGFTDTQCGIKAFRADVADAVFPLTTIDRFAIDVEIIYVLLKYRLDIKRIPVRLVRNAPSSVRVARDAFRAARDIGRVRTNWAMGRYADPWLAGIVERETAADLAEWREGRTGGA